MSSTVPILVLKEGTERTRGRDAQRNNIMAAKIIAETIRTTLGPRGMDKMLVTSIGDVTITNDGATILKDLDVQHPAAKMLVEVAKTQDSEVGDGTKTAVILTGELLEKAEALIDQGVHPTIIIDGFRKAVEKASEILKAHARKIDVNDETVLKNIAITTMGSKGVAVSKTHFANITVQAIKRIMEKTPEGKIRADVDLVKVLKKHGKSLEETELVEGIVIDKEVAYPQMPKRVQDAKIALLNAKLEIEKTEFDAKINIENPEQMQLFLNEEERMLREMVDQVAKTGANVLVCEKGIDDLALHFLAKKGILTLKNASSGDMEKLAKATGGSILASSKDLSAEALGSARLVEEVKIGDSKLVYVRDCKNPRAVTIVVRGGTEHVVDEADRSLHDALCVVRNAVEDGKIVPGGGATHMQLSKQLREYATSVGGRAQLAIEAFSDALESVPLTLAENAGLDPINIAVTLRAKHGGAGGESYGVDVFSGEVRDMYALNVIEPVRVTQQVIQSASEAACMILKIDDVVASKGTEAKGKPPPAPGGEEF